MNQPSPMSPVPKRWLILRRVAFGLQRSVKIVSVVVFWGGVIYCIVDVVRKTMDGSFSWLYAIVQFFADVAFLSFDIVLLFLFLLGLSHFLIHMVPSEYRTKQPQ